MCNQRSICSGDNCPLKKTCYLYWWRGSDKVTGKELKAEPMYKDGKCKNYQQIEYYGQ